MAKSFLVKHGIAQAIRYILQALRHRRLHERSTRSKPRRFLCQIDQMRADQPGILGHCPFKGLVAGSTPNWSTKQLLHPRIWLWAHQIIGCVHIWCTQKAVCNSYSNNACWECYPTMASQSCHHPLGCFMSLREIMAVKSTAANLFSEQVGGYKPSGQIVISEPTTHI